MSDEKRRYFRINDTIDFSFRVLKPQSPALKLSTDILDDIEMLQVVDAELDALSNALWDSDPKFAKAIGLLNQKINLLTNQNQPDMIELMAQYDHQYPSMAVNLSASGMAFTCDVQLEVGDRLEMLLFLKPSVSGITLRGTVVASEHQAASDGNTYFNRVEFDLEAKEKEQLIQHIVRRQVETIGHKGQAV